MPQLFHLEVHQRMSIVIMVEFAKYTRNYETFKKTVEKEDTCKDTFNKL